MTTPEPAVPRITGLLIIEVRNSNPNGDPEREGAPRQRPDGKGEISPVSVKRKLRDLVAAKEGPVWRRLQVDLGLLDEGFEILESRGRVREKISRKLKDSPDKFRGEYWDGRLFGNTFLEDGGSDTIRAGVAHFGVGISVAPIDIGFQTWTSKAGVEEGKDRGMAPMGFRIVRHGLYTMPFFVNPSQAHKTGCTAKDVELMLRLLPYAYPHCRSVVRSEVEILHAHAVTHKDPLGSFSDFALIDALTPTRVEAPDEPSGALADYRIPRWRDIEGTEARVGWAWSRLGDYRDYAEFAGAAGA